MQNYEELAQIGNSAARAAEFKRIEPTASLSLFIDALSDPYPALRSLAADALSTRMNDELARDLVERAGKGDARLRSMICLALSGTAHGAEFLKEMASDDDSDVRYAAFVGLADYPNESTRKIVLDRLKAEKDHGVLVVCAQICATNKWAEAGEVLTGRYLELARGIFRKNLDRFQLACVLAELKAAGLALGEPVVDDVLRDLVDNLKSDETASAASQALVSLGDKRAIPELMRVTKSFRVHPIHRVEAALALHGLGDRHGLELLSSYASGKRKDARGWALINAGKFQIQELRAMIDALAMSSDYHADTALLALRLYGDEDARALVAEVAQSHEDEEQRQQAADTLIHWEHKDVF